MILRPINELEPGTIYPSIDDAMRAASCLCALDPQGATIWGTTTGPEVFKATGEAYTVACKAIRADGSTWAEPDDTPHWSPVYTITRAGR